MFFVVRCAIFSSFRRMYNNFVTFTPPQNLAKRKQYITVAFNHLFTGVNLVIISIRDHISLRRCPYLPSMGLDRCALFLWRRCILRKCKLVSHDSTFFLFVNVFTLFFALMCFMMPFSSIYTKIQRDYSLYNNSTLSDIS